MIGGPHDPLGPADVACRLVRAPDEGALSLDAFLHDQLRGLGETLLRLVEDKPAFARRQSEYWQQVARLEQRQAERLDWRRPQASKTPSGMSLKVSEILAEGAVGHPEKER